MEPWEKVYIKLGRKDDVSQIDHHLRIACVTCHGGNASQPNSKELAHKDLVRDPSEYKTGNGQLTNSCAGGSCHESFLIDDYSKSLHQNLWGERVMVAARSGVDNFAQCPQSTQDGFNGECTGCHATCGQCHVSIPNSAGGGFPKNGPLYSSHKFYKTPDMKNNCTACHGSRIAHDFYGEEGERDGDVHYKEEGMTCLSQCHTKDEMHGGIAETDQNSIDRYHYEELPSCTQGCHKAETVDSLAIINQYHKKHFEDLTCYICHSQPTYNNCTGCHVNDAWKTDPEYQEKNPEKDFRIGLNPLTFEDGDFRKVKFALLRHIPIVPDSYSNWGGASATLPGYDDVPTWKYTSPHNILKFTDHTRDVNPCFANCHINHNEENKKLFLLKSYVDENWPNESKANESVVVDSHLPEGWE